MSRVVVIGGTGHIGTYLVPRLVRGGHDVVAMSRGSREPYHPSPEWRTVTTVIADRDAEDTAGAFGARIAALGPDVVIDLICFTADSARQLVAALRPARPLLLHCGTIWVHGPALRVPVTESEPQTATATTAPARRRSRPCCTARPWRAACPRSCCTPATSADRAGR